MKFFKAIFLFLCIGCSLNAIAEANGDTLLPRVDKRVELLCIAARLAEINGFTDESNPGYVRKIEEHFGTYRNHPLISLLKEMKPKLDDSYWEIPAVAAHHGQPPDLKPVLDFTDTTYVDGWESRTLSYPRFTELLHQFYRDTNADSFFRSMDSYYRSIDSAYVKQGTHLNKRWLENFFALKESEEYFPIVALGMRKPAYLRINFSSSYRQTFTIFETKSFDTDGIPTTFSNEIFPRMMLHEYIHAFANQLIDSHINEMQESAEEMLKNPVVSKSVEKTFYDNWQFLLYESLVRACAIRYMMSNNNFGVDIEKEIASQEKAGFLWMRGLLKELSVYEESRDKYRNLEDFMPQIKQFFDRTASELKVSHSKLGK